MPTAALSARRLEATPGIEPGYADLQFCGVRCFHWVIPPHVAFVSRSSQQDANGLGKLAAIVPAREQMPVAIQRHYDRSVTEELLDDLWG